MALVMTPLGIYYEIDRSLTPRNPIPNSMPHPRDIPIRRVLAPLLCAAALAACETPPYADVPISDAAAARERPDLGATARFTRALERAEPSALDLAAQSDDLAARAEALRARAGGLSAPVLTPDERDRLTQARTAATP